MKKRKHSGKKNLYHVVTREIIDLLENHTLSWDKPWVALSSDGKLSHNALSQHTYSGLNQIMLSVKQMKAGYPYSGWLTFHQVKEAGGNVLSGEKSSEIFFYKILYYDQDGKRLNAEKVKGMTADQQDDLKKRFTLRYFNVFNVAQTEGLPGEFYEIEELPNLTEVEKDDKVEKLIHETTATIIHKPGNRAYYDSTKDVITLPNRNQFTGKESYYATALHELAHWTGHQSRLDRNIRNAFGTEAYAKEELVAELASAFISAELGFSKRISNNAAYIQSWIKELKNDHRYIFGAIRDAEQAVAFIQESKERERKQKVDQQIENIKEKKGRGHDLER